MTQYCYTFQAVYLNLLGGLLFTGGKSNMLPVWLGETLTLAAGSRISSRISSKYSGSVLLPSERRSECDHIALGLTSCSLPSLM